MKIKLVEPLGISESVLQSLSEKFTSEGHEFVHYDSKPANESELADRAKDAEVLMIANYPCPESILEKINNLKMISIAFTGFDHVGMNYVRANDIVASNSAGFSDDSVAELVIGLAINVLRNITQGDAATRDGKTIQGLIGNELKGKTVGVIGTGRIGSRVAEIFLAFGCKVIAFAPNPKQNCLDMGVQYKTTLEEVMSESDIISLNMPSNENTRGMISREMINLMKPTSVMINCARGAVIDNQALADALNDGKIAGAGIDVFDMEPPIPSDYPLLNCKNTLLTPHVAYATEESMVKRATICFENVYRWLEGKPQNVVS